MAYTTINKPSLYFNTITWSGDNTNRTLTGVGFQPDFIWWKQRNGTDDNRLIDSVRGEGTTSYKILFSNTTDAEYNGNDNGGSQGNINAINSDGFTGAQGTVGWNNWNGNTYTYVAWNWLGANTTVSNTAGTITSTVSANTTSGFSIVSYTGNGTSGATVGHGLGVAPAFTIVKNRSMAGRNFQGFHQSLGNTKSHLLNSTEVPRTNVVFWNNTSPTSTLITLGNDADVNESGKSFIAYCFAEVKGYSKFGSYTGNGSTDGTFIYTGFKPAFVLQKTTSTTSDWNIVDNKRSTYNVNNLRLNPNTSSAESTSPDYCDLLSNGFKFRASSSGINGSGETNIYAAFAENPLVGTNNTPATAR